MVRLPITLMILLLTGPVVDAQEKEATQEKPGDAAKEAATQEPSTDQTGEPAGIQIQRLDEPLFPFEPVKGRTEAEQKQVEARAWFLTGRLLQTRQKYRDALEAFEKASKRDPNSVRILRSLIEVSIHLRQTEKAVQYAIRAVELDPNDFELLRQLGVEMVKARRLGDAVRYLEQARKSPELKKTNGYFVLINRDLGIIYSGIGEADKAADCYQVVLDALLNPNEFGLDARTVDEIRKHSSTSWERIGQVMLRADRTEPARIALERAVKQRNGRPGGVNFLLAQVYRQEEKFDESLSQLDLFFKARLGRGRAPYQLLSELLEKTGKSDSLLSRLQELSKDDPRNQDLKFFLAQTLVVKGELDQAEAIYRESLDDKVTSEAYLGLASIYRRQKKARELLENLALALERTKELPQVAQLFESEMKAIEEDEKLLDALIEAGRELTGDSPGKRDFARLNFLARICGQAERVDTAAEFFRQALKANPARAKSILSALADVYMQVERYADAAAVYQEAVEHPLAQDARPDNYLRLSVALELTGKTDEALEAVGEANKLVPGGHPALSFREAWIYYHSHQFPKAAELYEAFLKKYPNAGTLVRQAKFGLSNIYVQMGQMKKGEEILERFYQENPEDVGINNDLGYLYADQGKNLEKARKMIELAVKAEPENAAYADSMGWVLFKLGEVKEAAEWLEKASKLENGDDPTIFDHLGDCYHKLEDAKKAEDSWKKALELAEKESRPDEDLIRKIKEKLKIGDSEAGKVRKETESDP